jgi:hypothetical protein
MQRLRRWQSIMIGCYRHLTPNGVFKIKRNPSADGLYVYKGTEPSKHELRRSSIKWFKQYANQVIFRTEPNK